jgi:cell division protein FtsW (lipid II flippase)
VFGGSRWQRLIGPMMAIAALVAMLLSQRRAGLIAVMIAVAIFTISLIRINRRAFFMIAIPAALVAVVYFPLFWNNTGTLGQVARAVRSLSSPDPRDAASNLWRDLEAINVRATIQSDPLMGIGFGKRFLQVVAVPDISEFEFWDYEAHHNILWVWMKTGAIGFISFFTLILGGVARAIWLARRVPHAEGKTLALVSMSAIVMSAVFCYVDLGLSGVRVPLLLGISMGTLGVIDRIRA